MLVICCGAKRSGSTISYSYTSNLLNMHGVGVAWGFETKIISSPGVGALQKFKSDQIYVIKTHDFRGAWSAMSAHTKLIYTHRDPEDIIRSGIAKFSWSESVAREYLLNYCQQIQTIQNSEDFLSLNYEEMINNPAQQLQRIMEFLNLPTDQAGIQFILENNERPKPPGRLKLILIKFKRIILVIFGKLKLQHVARAMKVPNSVARSVHYFLGSIGPNSLVHADHNTDGRKDSHDIDVIIERLHDDIERARHLRREKFSLAQV